MYLDKWLLWLGLLVLVTFEHRQVSGADDYNILNRDGSYEFGYDNPDSFHHSQANRNNVVRGEFGGRNPGTGAIDTTQYTAGPRGFRPRGKNIVRKYDLGQSGPRPIGSRDDPYFDPNEDPSYNFAFRTRGYSRQEAANRVGDVTGKYTYLDDIGERHNVEYIAGKNTGFHVKTPFPDSNPRAYGPLYFRGRGKPIPRGRTSIQRGLDGSYRFISAGPDQRRTETSDATGHVRGSYTYLDDKGVQHSVHYIAGPETGYRVLKNVKGPHLPTVFPFGRPDIIPSDFYDYLRPGADEVFDTASSGHVKPPPLKPSRPGQGGDGFNTDNGSDISGDDLGDDYGKPGVFGGGGSGRPSGSGGTTSGRPTGGGGGSGKPSGSGGSGRPSGTGGSERPSGTGGSNRPSGSGGGFGTSGGGTTGGGFDGTSEQGVTGSGGDDEFGTDPSGGSGSLFGSKPGSGSRPGSNKPFGTRPSRPTYDDGFAGDLFPDTSSSRPPPGSTYRPPTSGTYGPPTGSATGGGSSGDGSYPDDGSYPGPSGSRPIGPSGGNNSNRPNYDDNSNGSNEVNDFSLFDPTRAPGTSRPPGSSRPTGGRPPVGPVRPPGGGTHIGIRPVGTEGPGSGRPGGGGYIEHGTIVTNVGDELFSVPPGVSVRAHVQAIDLLPLGPRSPSPSEQLQADDELKAETSNITEELSTDDSSDNSTVTLPPNNVTEPLPL